MRTRIVTLAQLAGMPVGTRVSPLKMEAGKIIFNVQGVVALEPLGTLTHVGENWLEITDDLPEIFINYGRVETRKSITHYILPAWHPHRFVVWTVSEVSK